MWHESLKWVSHHVDVKWSEISSDPRNRREWEIWEYDYISCSDIQNSILTFWGQSMQNARDIEKEDHSIVTYSERGSSDPLRSAGVWSETHGVQQPENCIVGEDKLNNESKFRWLTYLFCL